MDSINHTALVPPQRLANLLRGKRLREDIELHELCARTGYQVGISELAEIESAARRITDAELELVAAAYGVETSEIIPPRSELVVDPVRGRIAGDTHTASFDANVTNIDAVLVQYLAMVYEMRKLEPGTSIGLRAHDLEVLCAALGLGDEDARARLAVHMSNPVGVSLCAGRLHHRVLVPDAGVLVAETGSATLSLIASP